jgi:hypothetical protein
MKPPTDDEIEALTGVRPAPRSNFLTKAGYTVRRNSLVCDECGRSYSRLMLPIHRCLGRTTEPQTGGEP